MAFGLTLRKEWKGGSEANETYRTVDVVVSKAFDVWSDGNVPDYSYNLSFCVGVLVFNRTVPPDQNLTCKHGTATVDKCVCDANYEGPECSQCDSDHAGYPVCDACPGYGESDGNGLTCSGHGKCNASSFSSSSKLFSLSSSSRMSLSSSSGNVTVACDCDQGYIGDSCGSCADGYNYTPVNVSTADDPSTPGFVCLRCPSANDEECSGNGKKTTNDRQIQTLLNPFFLPFRDP